MEYPAPQITGREEPFRSEIRERLWADCQGFASRDLGEYDIAYLFIDGVAERIRPGSRRDPVLAAWGFTASGSKVLLHLMAGSKEDAETVGAFFQDMRHRGLGDPLLVVSDGAPGIVKAIETCFPRSARQRCLAHRMRNLVAKVPDDAWPEFKGRVTAAYQAPSRAIARDLAEGVVRDYAKELPSAVRCFEDDFEACIAHLRMPINHRRAIRTTNLLERLFLEERRRLKVLPHAFGERPVLKLMFAAMTRASERWRAIRITDFERRQMAAVRDDLDDEYRKHVGAADAPAASAHPEPISSRSRTCMTGLHNQGKRLSAAVSLTMGFPLARAIGANFRYLVVDGTLDVLLGQDWGAEACDGFPIAEGAACGGIRRDSTPGFTFDCHDTGDPQE